jgi:hypothetical protein
MENSGLISEHQLATNYPTLWSAVTPLSDGYWAIQNKMIERRITPPLKGISEKSMRGVINEVAFQAFSELQPKIETVIDREQTIACIENNLDNVIEYINRLNQKKNIFRKNFDTHCMREAAILTFRHLHFFPPGSKIFLRPHFKGCGDIAECYGDVVAGDCLYEIKAGDRNFRISDLRQLLIYSALSYANKSWKFSRIGLVNPRTGHYWVKTIEQVCIAIAGQTAIDTLENLIRNFSEMNVLTPPD